MDSEQKLTPKSDADL